MLTRPLIFVALGTAAAAAIAGCGGSSSSSGKAKATSPAIATLTAHRPGKVPTAGPTATAIPASDFTATVSGVVTDHKSHAPINGVTIVVGDHLRTTKSDAQGRYSVSFPARALISVTASKSGYAGALAVGKLPANGRATVNLQIVKAVSGAPPVPPMPTQFGSK